MIARAEQLGGFDRLLSALDSFRCSLDEDIEIFLREKAIRYSENKWCSVYLILNESEFDSGRIKIEAYFTLSLKALSTQTTSKSKIKDVTGGFANRPAIPFVLIGQLGKYIYREGEGDTVIKSAISGEQILDYAFEVILESDTLIPCGCVLVECNSEERVQKVYTDYKFKFFQFDGTHYQFYKKI